MLRFLIIPAIPRVRGEKLSESIETRMKQSIFHHRGVPNLFQ